MSPTEQRYAQIEKEALAFTWACERLSANLIGLIFHIETDYKPLVPLFSTKRLDELPITSSPYYPQGNGEAKRAVGTIKRLLEKGKDPYLAYRSTPLQNGYSPSELLMSRKLRALVPVSREELEPSVPDYAELKTRDKKAKDRQKRNHDKRHRA